MLTRCRDCYFFVVPDGSALVIGQPYPCHRNPPIAVPLQSPNPDDRTGKINLQIVPIRPMVLPMDHACGEFKNV